MGNDNLVDVIIDEVILNWSGVNSSMIGNFKFDGYFDKVYVQTELRPNSSLENNRKMRFCNHAFIRTAIKIG